MIKSIIWILKIFLVYIALSISLFLMLRTVVNYLSFETNVQFLAFKQDYLHITTWKVAFYIHVFSAVVALFAGFTQFSSELLKNHRKLHRTLGHIYVWNILIINCPAALIMGIYANGGWQGKLAFLTLDFLWFGFTLVALMCAIKRRFVAHKNFMLRSYALTFSAITLRSWKIVLAQIPWLSPSQLYVTEAWLGFLPNLIVAELIIYWMNKKTSVEKELNS